LGYWAPGWFYYKEKMQWLRNNKNNKAQTKTTTIYHHFGT
jgi:hypothetical protein